LDKRAGERAFVDRAVERRQVVAHDGVERRLLGPVTLVGRLGSGGGGWRHAPTQRDQRAAALRLT